MVLYLQSCDDRPGKAKEYVETKSFLQLKPNLQAKEEVETTALLQFIKPNLHKTKEEKAEEEVEMTTLLQLKPHFAIEKSRVQEIYYRCREKTI